MGLGTGTCASNRYFQGFGQLGLRLPQVALGSQCWALGGSGVQVFLFGHPNLRATLAGDLSESGCLSWSMLFCISASLAFELL